MLFSSNTEGVLRGHVAGERASTPSRSLLKQQEQAGSAALGAQGMNEIRHQRDSAAAGQENPRATSLVGSPGGLPRRGALYDTRLTRPSR